MELNPQYEDIGKGFVAQYYAMFDNPGQRENVVNFYSCNEDKEWSGFNIPHLMPTFPYNTDYFNHSDKLSSGSIEPLFKLSHDPILLIFILATDSFMTFEGLQIQGAPKIQEKLASLTFQKISRVITAVDSQPMFDGGVLINVLGRLQCDDDPPHAFSQVFVLKPLGGTFFCAHDIFRLNIHNTA